MAIVNLGATIRPGAVGKAFRRGWRHRSARGMRQLAAGSISCLVGIAKRTRLGLISATLAVGIASLAGLARWAVPAHAGIGFGPTTHYPVTETRPTALWFGDLSASGQLDLAFTDGAGGRVGVINEVGWPYDSPATYYAVGANPRSIAAGDFNADGFRDLVTANSGSNTVSVLINGWNYGWGKAFHSAVNYQVGTNPVFVVGGDNERINSVRTTIYTPIDFNRDGKRDIAAVNRGSNSVSILLGNGDGSFAASHNYAAGTDPVAAAANDLTGDGVADIVVANAAADSYSVLKATGSGGFASPLTHPLASGSHPTAVAPADPNGDGPVDLMIVNGGLGSVSVLMGNGDGTFREPTTYATGASPNSIALGDLDDNYPSFDPDIAVTNSGSNTVSILLGNGDGTYRGPTNHPTGANPSRLIAFAPHLAVTDYDDKELSILAGPGDGAVNPAEKQVFGARPAGIVSADFNGDGKLDLANGNFGAESVSSFLGNGDGTFQPARDSPTGPNTIPVRLAAGDLDRAGKVDIVTVDRGPNDVRTDSVSVLSGKRDGTFKPPGQYRVGGDPAVWYYPFGVPP